MTWKYYADSRVWLWTAIYERKVILIHNFTSCSLSEKNDFWPRKRIASLLYVDQITSATLSSFIASTNVNRVVFFSFLWDLSEFREIWTLQESWTQKPLKIDPLRIYRSFKKQRNPRNSSNPRNRRNARNRRIEGIKWSR
jgi:hypothetical protein